MAATPAVLVVPALFMWLVLRAQAGTNVAGLQMPAMHLQHRVAYWWPFLMGETLGLAALIWSYLAVLVGLLSSRGRSRWSPLSRGQLNELHRQLSLTTLLLIFGHVVFVAIGAMSSGMTTRVVNVVGALVPFSQSWHRWPYAYGILAFYLAILVGPTYYLRGRLGARAWKVAHRCTLLVYVLTVVHTMYFDDFSVHGPYRAALWIAQIPLLALLLWRLRRPFGAPPGAAAAQTSRSASLTRRAAAVVTAGALVGVVFVVGTGRTGGLPSPFIHQNHPNHSHPTTKMPGM